MSSPSPATEATASVTPPPGHGASGPPPSPKSPLSPLSPLSPIPNERSSIPLSQLDPIIEHMQAEHTEHRRHSSISSVSFKQKSTSRKAAPPSRIRDSSPPPPSRFQRHVSFDNFSGGEATDKNTISYTLNMKHKGYQFKRRSRTFMVGIDENDYSDIALQWILDELVDDGDEIICLQVIDKDSKLTNDRNLEKKQHQKLAKDIMERIQLKNGDNRAISIVLEFAVGKINDTFEKMIQLYEPAMLIVGTRGRSLGGFQGLMANRNSFSRWCLQNSPIPVVVVRPTEKRMKKKKKRDADPTRQDYAKLLRDSGVEEHESAFGSRSNSIFEEPNDADTESHLVAQAMGLPATFDPTLKPIHLEGSRPLMKVDSGKSDATTGSQGSLSPDSRPNSPATAMKSPKSQLESPAGSVDESSDEEEGEGEGEGEFEAVSGQTLLKNAEQQKQNEVERKQRLHEMEIGEAAALMKKKERKGSSESVDDPAVDDEDDEDEEGVGNNSPPPAPT